MMKAFHQLTWPQAKEGAMCQREKKLGGCRTQTHTKEWRTMDDGVSWQGRQQYS